MPRTDSFRFTDAGPSFPKMMTLPASANSLYPKGTIVTQSPAGRAVSPATSDATGFPARGVAKATFINTTGSEMGGLDDSGVIEIDCGIFGFNISGTTPVPGDLLYVVDNQTVSLDPSNGTRGVAGKCCEVRANVAGTNQAFVLMGPAVPTAGQGSQAEINVPLTSFVDPDGDPMVKFVNGASAVPGFNLADSEAYGLRWNNNATFDVILTQVGLPMDLDEARPMFVDLIVSKTGATPGDATTFTMTAFILAVGDLHDADANAGSVSAAINGSAAAKTTQLVTLTIAAADIPAGVRTMTMTIQPTNGTLGTDDLILHAVKIRYTRK
jgi:hypothetical protein